VRDMGKQRIELSIYCQIELLNFQIFSFDSVVTLSNCLRCFDFGRFL